MQLYYNSAALHDLGKLIILGQGSAGEPAEAPQRWRHTLRVRLNFHEQTYADNQALVQSVRAILLQQSATLRWVDDSGSVWLNQPVRLEGHDWPEDPNAQGTYYQSLTLTFSYYTNFTTDQHQGLTASYKPLGAASAIVLGNVEGYRYDTDIRRFDDLRADRALATGRFSMRGKWLADTTASVAVRRPVLIAQAEALRAAVHAQSSGTWTYGTSTETVKIEGFTADINQAMDAIDWAVTASVTEFPDTDAGYAQAEYTVSTTEDKPGGRLTLSLDGRIAADSAAAALNKLAAVRRAALVNPSNWANLRTDAREEHLSGTDGDSFVRLSFSEEYSRLWGSIVFSQLRLSDNEELAGGTIRRSYSGTVTARGTTWAAAYATAYNRALQLGDKKHAFRLGSSIDTDDNQLSTGAVVSGTGITGSGAFTAGVVVSLSFRFDYAVKSERVYAEMTSTWTSDTFGQDQEEVSGFVAAGDALTARSLYATLRAGYASQLIRGERVSEGRQKIQVQAGVTAASTVTPPLETTYGSTVNTSERMDHVLENTNLAKITTPPSFGTTYARIWTRLDFGFTFHRPKPTGTRAMRYEYSVALDYVAREIVTTLTGTIWANNQADAEAALAAFTTGLSLGNKVNRRTSSGAERSPTAAPAAFVAGADTFAALQFDETYVAPFTGSAAILECSLEEDLQLSGSRVVVQATATGNDVFQLCGTASATRTLNGSVTATDEATGLEWIRKMHLLPLPDAASTAGDRQSQPARLTIEPVWIPLTDGVPRSGTYGSYGAQTGNLKCVRLRFSFTEHLAELTLNL